MGQMVSSIATTGNYYHPVLDAKGWWSKNRDADQIMKTSKKENRLLIIGKNGTLGNAFMKICEHRCIPYIALAGKIWIFRMKEM